MSDEQEIILVWLCISFFSLVEMVPMQIIVFILESRNQRNVHVYSGWQWTGNQSAACYVLSLVKSKFTVLCLSC